VSSDSLSAPFFCLSVSNKERKTLTDTAPKHLKKPDKTSNDSARDGMYALVKTTGAIVFRLDYRLHGRRETLTIGQYGRDGITLAE
jgi:hypothetical protein